MPYLYSWDSLKPCSKCGKIRPEQCLILSSVKLSYLCFKCTDPKDTLHIGYKYINDKILEVIIFPSINDEGKDILIAYQCTFKINEMSRNEKLKKSHEIYYGWIKEKPTLPETKYDIDFSFGD